MMGVKRFSWRFNVQVGPVLIMVERKELSVSSRSNVPSSFLGIIVKSSAEDEAEEEVEFWRELTGWTVSFFTDICFDTGVC